MEMNSPIAHSDITGTVDVTDAGAVCCAVKAIFSARYLDENFDLLDVFFADFQSLYRGEYKGYLACDTDYHDIQHVLDVTLATARLVDGFEIDHGAEDQLGPELAKLAILVALFHDAGYIRRADDEADRRGAEYTAVHVSRSAQFMAEYLPGIGLSQWVPYTDQLVHFTGYEILPEDINLADRKLRTVGALVGTADVVAQMADVAYLEKCRDRLYPEFELGGMTRSTLPGGSEQVHYASAEDLLVKTPQFIKDTIQQRLEGYFGGLYHHLASHFGGRNLYFEALQNNCRHLESLLEQNDPSLLAGSSLRTEY